MKAVEFTDNNIKYVELYRGEYSVNGKIIELTEYQNKVQVESFDNICPIKRTSVVNFYTSNGDDRMDVEDYNSQKNMLALRKAGNEDDGYKWLTLDDEFNYRKFTELWKPIFKDIEIVGDPISFSMVQTVLDTGCPFITSSFINGTQGDVDLFSYDRHNALLSIVHNYFKLLGMEYQNDISYSDTKNKKVWGNSTHSCIRYVTAFGTYVFNDLWGNAYTLRGKLSDMLAKYKSDKESIEQILKLKYSEHFGKIDADTFDFDSLLNHMRSARNCFAKVSAKSASYSDHNSGKKHLNDAISFVEHNFKTQ